MIIHNPDELALFFKNYRKKQQYTQSELSQLVGLKQATISAFENKPESTKLETLFRLLSAANLELHIGPRNTKNTQGNWTEEW